MIRRCTAGRHKVARCPTRNKPTEHTLARRNYTPKQKKTTRCLFPLLHLQQWYSRDNKFNPTMKNEQAASNIAYGIAVFFLLVVSSTRLYAFPDEKGKSFRSTSLHKTVKSSPPLPPLPPTPPLTLKTVSKQFQNKIRPLFEGH